MTVYEPNDALSDEEEKAFGYLSEEQERHIRTRPLQEQKGILAEVLRWRGPKDLLEKKVRELIEESRRRLDEQQEGEAKEDE